MNPATAGTDNAAAAAVAVEHDIVKLNILRSFIWAYLASLHVNYKQFLFNLPIILIYQCFSLT